MRRSPGWLRDIRTLSSGTLSTLTGARDYETIDRVHHAFIRHGLGVAGSSPSAFDDWRHAWDYFTRTITYARALDPAADGVARCQSCERAIPCYGGSLPEGSTFDDTCPGCDTAEPLLVVWCAREGVTG